MQDVSQDPARLAVLDELRKAALDTYGEERVAEAAFQTALGLTATAIWRVAGETLDLLDPEPSSRG